MPWATDAELLSLVATVHGYASAASAPAHWSGLVARANASAFNKLRGLMRDKGYDDASLARWSDRLDYNLQGGLCAALRLIGLPQGQEGLSLSNYCKVWDELKELGQIYDDAGVLIDPTDLSARVSHGEFDTSGDTFSRDTRL